MFIWCINYESRNSTLEIRESHLNPTSFYYDSPRRTKLFDSLHTRDGLILIYYYDASILTNTIS
uniref:Ovule protein n=1 Tax=Heterorhabditis bacteriophora TaxID=37862 RepID=A0A1I7XJS0_HETBA